MAIQHTFDGAIQILPGVYSSIKSGFRNPPSPLSFGNLLIIDTGSGAGAGGGAGVNGSITSGSDSIYEFDNVEDFRSFVEKNIWWFLANPLFFPLSENGVNSQGVSKITYIKAATTTPAILNAIFGNDASDSVGNTADIKLKVRSEGLVGNGALNTVGELSRGYAFKMTAGIMDTSKAIMNFYRGTFKGLDQNGNLFNGIAEADSIAELVCQSPEFSLVSDLIDWMNTNADFNEFFKYDSDTSVIGHGHIDSTDVIQYSSYTLAIGGTESYGASDLTEALNVAKALNIDFVFCDKFGTNSQHANNIAIKSWAINTSRFKPQVYIASGSVSSTLAASLLDAIYYNSQQVTIVHGGVKIAKTNAGFNDYDSYYKAAVLLGREAGMAPQIPLTFKNISIDGERHILNDVEKAKALNGGLLVSYPDNGVFEVLKGVNSLQKNTFLLNDDGTTHSKQLYRIARQINKEIIITAKAELLKNPNGTNRNTLSELDVQQWLKRFLASKVAQSTSDNLILGFQDIVVTRNADAYNISYKFTPNTEISFLFFTGLMIDIN